MRLQSTTGLDEVQLDEVTARVEKLLPEPWDKGRGRKKKLSPRDGVAVAVAYLRHNTVQEVLGERWNVAQSNISDKITYLTPLVADALEEFVPTEQDATEMVTGRVCLLDGSLSPAGPGPTTTSCGPASTAQPATISWSSPVCSAMSST